jgi:fructokinase
MKKNVLAFGELLWDVLPTQTILGGAPFNFAYRINTLGDVGLMISRLGRDRMGNEAFEKVTELGLDSRFIQWDDQYPTGTVPVIFDQDKNPDFTIIPHVAYDHIVCTDELLKTARVADCLCFGSLAQREAESRETLYALLEQAEQSLKFFDINLRKDCYSLETVTYSLRHADVLKLNENEARQLADMLDVAFESIPAFCRNMIDMWQLKYCLVTLGEKGAFAFSTEDGPFYSPGYEIELVDSLGAGDSFSAGFVSSILQDNSMAEACACGNILGALVSTRSGATPNISRSEIRRFKTFETERIGCQDLMEYAE